MTSQNVIVVMGTHSCPHGSDHVTQWVIHDGTLSESWISAQKLVIGADFTLFGLTSSFWPIRLFSALVAGFLPKIV